VHVPPGDEGVQRRERGPEGRLPLLVRRRGLDLRGQHVAYVGHLLRPAHDHDVVHARCHRQVPLAERQAPGRARRLHPGGRYVVPRQTGVVCYERPDVLLLDELPRGHVAHVQGVDLLARQVGIPHRGQARLYAQIAEGLVPQLPELGVPDADDRYLPHSAPSFILILPRYLA